MDIFYNVLVSIFSGGGVALFVFKKIAENQLNKSLKKYQHDLDRKKEILANELSIHASHQIYKITTYEKEKREAIKKIYQSVTKTSISNSGFKKIQAKNLTGEDLYKEYCKILTLNFDAYTNSFKSIQNSFDTLQNEAIYIDSELEKNVSTCLYIIHKTYTDNFNKYKKNFDMFKKSNTLNKEHTINDIPFDINKFYEDSQKDWNQKTKAVREELKIKMRESLSL